MGTSERAPAGGSLRREVGLGGAVLLGLGSIVGTGVFVSIGTAAGVAGPAVVAATALAALVAACNAFSSAQLAAAHPVSGGTYEYGYTYLAPWLGFTAGWMFLLAKSASAATAALGFSGYLLYALGAPERLQVPLALAAAVVLTLLVAGGIRRSSRANTLIVSFTLASLAAFVAAGLPEVARSGGERLLPFLPSGAGDGGGATAALLHATALMFVAYTGYGRIATLGEEITAPRRNIPRAIVATLVISAALYVAVAVVAVGGFGAEALSRATAEEAAPLEVAARAFAVPGLAWLVAAGAITAMLAVLLNLVLGLSRVALAMGRRGDLPQLLGQVDAERSTPRPAVLAVGAVIAGLTLLGEVETTWAFSAFTVLVYYALTNLAALRLPRKDRLYPPAVAVCGLVGCLGLAFWVPPAIWASGLALLAAGLAWHLLRRRGAAG